MNTNTSQKINAILNTLLFGVMITVNTLANALPINGKTTRELSNQYPNFFVPTGITFAIWGIIYLLMTVLISYQMITAFSKTKRSLLNSLHEKLIGLTCVLNVAWILVWHYELVALSVMVMLLFLSTLIYLFVQLKAIQTTSFIHYLCIKLPISVYLGWISIATIANITALLVHINWNGYGILESTWTVIMLTIALLINLFMIFKQKAIPFALVFIWALMGIIVKRQADTIVYHNIIFMCYSCITIISLSIILKLSIDYKKVKTS